MADFRKENWLAYLAASRGKTGWQLANNLDKGSATFAGQQKPLSKGYKLLCDVHAAGFSWEEIGAALMKHKRLESGEE